MKNTRSTTLKKRLIQIIVLAVFATSMTGCKDKIEEAQEQGAKTDKEFIENMKGYKASESKESTF